MASTSNPTLCRVPWYCPPGFPSPTISFILAPQCAGLFLLLFLLRLRFLRRLGCRLFLFLLADHFRLNGACFSGRSDLLLDVRRHAMDDQRVFVGDDAAALRQRNVLGEERT